MTLESIVPSLELCKQLKELGYPQEDSLFYWAINNSGSVPKDVVASLGEILAWKKLDKVCAAPTASELGEWLRNYSEEMKKIIVSESSEEIRQLIERLTHSWDNPDEVNDRARLLIYLAHQGYIEFGKRV